MLASARTCGGVSELSPKGYSLTATLMATTLQKFSIVLTVLLIFVAVLVAAYWFTPPFFLQLGKHYLGGSDLLSISGFYRCDHPESDYCTVSRESLSAAVANDPSIRNWWPVRVSFLSEE